MAIQLGQAFIALHADGAALAGEVRAEMEAALAEARATAGLAGGGAAGAGAAEGAMGATAAADEASAAMTHMGSAGAEATGRIIAGTSEASAALEEMGTAGASATGRITSGSVETDAALAAMGEAGVAAAGQIAAGTDGADAALGRVKVAAAEAGAAVKTIGTAADETAVATSAAADKTAVSAERMASSTAGAAKSAGILGMSWKSVGEIAGGAAVYEAIKAAGNYQQQLARLQTSANEAAGNIKMVSAGMMGMATTVGFSATELSKAMYIVESGGFHGKAGLDALKASAEIAKQENADLMVTVQAVTTTLHDFAYTGLSAADAASKINEAVSFGKTNLQDFSSALHSVEPNAAAAHIKLEDVLGSLSAMTNSGMSAQQAAQNLAHTLSNYEKPTQPMIMSLAQVGINANDLTANLGKNGLAGTVQIVSQAILDHMGPAGQVAINSLNQNKNAAMDLVKMMDAMPPEVAKLSQGLLTGSTSIKDYRTDVRKMGGEAGAMGMQFLSLYQSQDGFNGILKTGGPAVQTYLGYLARGTGTVDALRTALMLTGTNTKYVNDAIAKIGQTSAQADGNVSKWAITQQTFNQKLAEAKSAVANFGVQMGTGLLPVLSDIAGTVATRVVPAAQALAAMFAKLANSQGVAILLSMLKVAFAGIAIAVQAAFAVLGGIINVFTKLPGPVQAALLALGAFKLIFATNMFGLFSSYGADAAKATAGVATAASAAAPAVAELGAAETAEAAAAGEAAAANVGLRGALADLKTGAASAASSMSTGITSSFRQVSAAAGEARAASRAAAAERFGMAEADLPRASGDLAAFGGALRNVATQGMGGLRAAGSSLLSMLGGPWMVGLAAAGGVAYEFAQSLGAGQRRIDANASSLLGYMKAQQAGGQGASDATKKIADFNSKIADAQKAYDAATQASRSYGEASYGSALGSSFAGQNVDELRAALDKAKHGLTSYMNGLSPVERDTLAVTKAQNDLNQIMATDPGNTTAAAAAASTLRSARADLDRVTQGLSNAERTHLQQLQDGADLQNSSIDASLAAQQAQVGLGQALKQYNTDAASGSVSTDQLKSEMLGLAQQSISAASAAGDAAAAQAKAKGVTDTSTIANLAELHSLQSVVSQLNGPGKAAVEARIAVLQHVTSTTALSTEAAQAMGSAIIKIPGSKDVIITAPTADQTQRLQALGFTVTKIPGTKDVTVHANTSDAAAALNNLVNTHWSTVVSVYTNTAGVHISGGSSASGTSTKAMGGLVHAYASGGFASMQGGIAEVVPPNTWRVIGDRVTDDEAYIPINSDPRSRAIWTAAGARMGLLGQGGGGKAVHVTYSPQYHLPPTADPNQVAAMVGANTARDFQLGLGSLSSLGWATS